MKGVTGAALALLLGFGASPSAQAAQRDMVASAAYAEGRLWVLTEQGQLFSLGENDAKPSAERVPGQAFGLCGQQGEPLVLVGKGHSPAEWTLLRREGREWKITERFATDGESFRALDCAGGEVTLLTSRRIVSVSQAGEAKAAWLSDSIGIYA